MSKTMSGSKRDFKTIEEYVNWMTNPDNYMRCSECPENVGHDGNGFDHRLPCDQLYCYVIEYYANEPEWEDESE